MKIRKMLAVLTVAATVLMGAACGTDTSATTESSTSTSSTDTAGGGAQGGGGPGGTDVSSVSTEEELIALVQEAYGDASLDLHRGHQPVQDVLDEVLTISHEELHAHMDTGQNLAAVATDIGVDPQTLIDALVASWGTAIDNVLAAGEITEAEAEQYREALTEAFTFRVNWNGEDATPTFSGIDA